MKRSLWGAFVVAAMVLAAPSLCADQHEAEEMLAVAYRLKVLPGHTLDFEKAVKDHMALHQAAGDTWRWEVWQVVAGHGLGDYITRSAGHSWAGLDGEIKSPDHQQQLVSEVLPHLSESSSRITEWMPELSRWPAGPDMPNMVEVTVFTVRYDAMPEFFNTIRKLHAMIGDKGLPYEYSWGKVVVGGEGAQLILAFPRSSWADFKPKSPDIWEMAAGVYGQHEAQTMRSGIGNAILAEENFVVAHRDDLGYVPGE